MKDPAFFDLVDRFIELANEFAADQGNHRVSAGILFAAARFNAHNFYASDGQPSNRETAIAYYCAEYRKMLLDNFDELRSPGEDQP